MRLASLRRATLAACLALTLAATPAAPGPRPAAAQEMPGFFSDVPITHPAFPAVNALYLLGVTTGDGAGRFEPDRPVTRAELVKMVLRAKGITIPATCQGQFADVPCGTWYAPAVELAYRLALVNGRGEGWFAPTAPVSRAELMVIVVRAMGDFLLAERMGWQRIAAELRPFPDRDQLPGWARPAAAWLARGGHLSPAEPLRPSAPATRAEVAMLLHNTLAREYPERQTAVVDGIPIRFAEAREMLATAYATGEPGVGTVTSSGVRVRVGVVATDPSVIPLGTFLYVEGYGYAVAADTGGAIKGNRIDLFVTDRHLAIHRFGARWLKVYILDPLPDRSG